MARLDRLSPVRRIAEIGAAIGREFSHELIAAVVAERRRTSCDGRTRRSWSPSELVYRRGTPPDAVYIVQARAGAGRRLQHPAARRAAAAARAHRRGARGRASRRWRRRSPNSSRATAPRAAWPSGRSTTGSPRPSVRCAPRRTSRPSSTSRGAFRLLTSSLPRHARAPADGAAVPDHARPGVAGDEGVGGRGGGAGVSSRRGAVPSPR